MIIKDPMDKTDHWIDCHWKWLLVVHEMSNEWWKMLLLIFHTKQRTISFGFWSDKWIADYLFNQIKFKRIRTHGYVDHYLLLFFNSSVILINFRCIFEYLANSSVIFIEPSSSFRSDTCRFNDCSIWLSHVSRFNNCSKCDIEMKN